MRRALAATLFCISGTAQVTYDDLRKADPQNWLSYSGSFHAQRHSLLNQIDTGTVGDLVASWVYHVPGASRLESVPVVVDGVMYVSQPNEVYALDGRSGLIWQYQHQPALRRGPNRGVAVFGNKVYVGTPDAHLIALDARTGNPVWKTKLADAKDGYWSPVAPLAVKGMIISASRRAITD